MVGRLAGAVAIFLAGFFVLPIAIGLYEGGPTSVFGVRMDLWWPVLLLTALVLLFGGLWLVLRRGRDGRGANGVPIS
jgi:dolichol kinase